MISRLYRKIALFSVSLFLIAGVGSPGFTQQEEEDPFGERLFPLEGDEDDDGYVELPPLGENPDTSEVLPPQRMLPIDVADPPDGAIPLRFRWEQSMNYDVNNVLRMGFEERPDLRQIYRSGLAIEYSPISRVQRELLPAWRMRVDVPTRETEGEVSYLLATVSNFTGVFEEPHELANASRTHQILKDAAFSFRIDDRGNVSDVRVHPPTNPLARASIEEMIRLLSVSHPVLPEEAVEPGARWTESIELSFEDGHVVKTQDVELSYHLEEWRPCGREQCAFIRVTQDVKAAARYIEGNLETQGASAGEGSGWFMLALDSGMVVSSRWNVSTRGRTQARQRDGDRIRELAESRYHIEIDSSVELLNWESADVEFVDLD